MPIVVYRLLDISVSCMYEFWVFSILVIELGDEYVAVYVYVRLCGLV